MKKNAFLPILVSLLPLCAAAQKHPQHIDLNQGYEDLGTGDQCVKEDNYSQYRTKIKSISPFYKAAKVVLVSFKNNSYQTASNGDTTTTPSRLPMHGDTVDYAVHNTAHSPEAAAGRQPGKSAVRLCAPRQPKRKHVLWLRPL